MRITTGVEARLIEALASLPIPSSDRSAAVRGGGETPVRLEVVTTGALEDRRDGKIPPLLAGRIPNRPGALFEAVRELCREGKVDSGTVSDVESCFLRLGFSRSSKGKLQKGSTRVKLDVVEIGGVQAVHVELKGREKGKKIEREGVIVAGAMLSIDELAQMRDRFEREVDAFITAASKVSVERLPTDIGALKKLIDSGRPPDDRAEEAGEANEIAAAMARIVEEIETLRARGDAPKGVVVYISGADAVGKTSTGRLILDAFEQAGYAPRRETFKAPNEAERAAPHERFRRGFPAEGEVVFWDRGPGGDVAYGKKDPHDVAGKFAVLERELEAAGTLLIKVQVAADPIKQVDTLGKRMARAFIADRIERTLVAHGLMTDARREGLAAIRDGLDLGDLNDVVNYAATQAGFDAFVDASGRESWICVDATKRHAARLALAGAVAGKLERVSLPTRAAG